MVPGRNFQKRFQEEENTPLVTIIETKVDDKIARAQDKRGSLYEIRLDKASFGGIHYPVPGSRWFVKKISNEWVLMARGFFQNPQLGFDFDPQPGDTFIGGEGTTYIVNDLVVMGSGGGGGGVSFDDIYPVDSIYLSLSASFDPNVSFTGTWSKLTDRFLIGAGSSYALAATGGATTHTLVTNNLPSHSHAVGTLANAAESTHTHGVGTFANTAESAHTHGVGTFANTAEASHTHAVGTYANAAESSHTHAVGTYVNAAESSHTHAVGTYVNAAESSHTHGIGSYVQASHQHGLATNKSVDQIASTGTAGVFGLKTDTSGDSGGFSPLTDFSTPSLSGTSAAGASHNHTISGSSAAGASHNHTISGSSAAGSSHNHTISGSSDVGSSHNHTFSGTSAAGSSHNHTFSGTSAAGASHNHAISGSTATTGSGTAVDHLPPYLAVYMWRRTA